MHKFYFKEKYLSKNYYIAYRVNNKLYCICYTKDFKIGDILKILKFENAVKIRIFDRQDKYIKYLKKESIKI